MKVGIYFHRISRMGGAQKMAVVLANALARDGFEVYLITRDEEDAIPFFPLRVDIHWLKLGKHTDIANKIVRLVRFITFLRHHKIAALIGFAASTEPLVFAACRSARVPFIAAERNSPTMYDLKFDKSKTLKVFNNLNYARAIVVQLPSFINGYPKHLHHKISVIGNPVEQPLTLADVSRPNNSGRYQILYCGRLSLRQKRIDLLIEAFHRLAPEFPDWDLLIVGDGGHRNMLSEEIRERNLVGRVNILGSVVDVNSIYLNSHVFALPSLWEGFSNALAEALSHGVPAVGFANASGVRDLIGTKNGWLANGKDNVVALESVLREAMIDANARAAKGNAGFLYMRQFELNKNLDQWREVLRDVTERPPIHQ